MRDEKQLLLDEIKDQIGEYGSFLIMKNVSLKANDATQFRNLVANHGGDIEVVRKRILLKAAQQHGIDLNLKDLPGQIGLIFTGKDQLNTTKAVFKFKQEKENLFEIIGGRIDDKMYNGQEVEAFSNLPSQEVLRAQFLGLLEAPMAQLVGVLNALLSSVIICIEQKANKGQD